MAIDKVLQSRREEIMGIAQRYGAKNVRVFGSRARGEARPNSDFDILVTVGEHTSLLDIIAIKQDLEDLLGSTVHVVTDDAISPYIREKVLKQAIAL
jgi:predicted nucleotidyltransferase